LETIRDKKAPERGFFSFSFENNLEKILNNLEIPDETALLLAVSGGIDSMVMATVMTKLLKNKKNCNLFRIVTINHNIREEKVSAADSQLVADYCQNILNVPCIVKTIPRGYIENLAKKRGRGIEEAARYERYRLLNMVVSEVFVQKKAFIFTAHQRNDLLETVLMRFLQGSSSVGPQLTRKEGCITYCKPFLKFSREEIEKYASENHIPFREDSSNADTSYLRNRMRHQLIPVLNSLYPGWDGAVIRGDEKRYEQLAVIKESAKKIQWQSLKNKVIANFSIFQNAPNAVCVQMLYDGLDKLNIKRRIAYSQLHLAVKCAQNFYDVEQNTNKKKIFSNANNIEIGYFQKQLYIKKMPNKVTEYGFFAIIEKCGTYTVDGGIIDVQDVSNNAEKNTVDWSSVQTLPFSIKGIKQKKETTKIFVENLGEKKHHNKVFVRFLRENVDE